MDKKISWVSMQNLIGGFAVGAEAAFGTLPKMIIHQGSPNDKHYINYMNVTRNLNIPVVELINNYLGFKSIEDENLFNKVISENSIDVIIMTPYCSGLSQMNSSSSGSKKRGDADNDQNQNMYNLCNLGFRINPRVVCYENAPGAYSKSGEATMNRVKEISDKFNYSMHMYKTDTIQHGIPQKRTRTFIMFYRDTNPPKFNYEKIDAPLLADYLELIPTDATHVTVVDKESLDDFYYFVMDHTNSKSFVEAITKVANKEKETWTSLQLTELIGFDIAAEYFKEKTKPKSEHMARHCYTKKLEGKNYWDASTIMTDSGKRINTLTNKSGSKMLHPTKERGYTVREMLWLMGMPHDFNLTDEKAWGNISQNVPVKTATFIGKQLKLYLENKLVIHNENYLKQDNTDKDNHEIKFTLSMLSDII